MLYSETIEFPHLVERGQLVRGVQPQVADGLKDLAEAHSSGSWVTAACALVGQSLV